MAGTYVTLNPAAIEELLHGPTGAVMRDMAGRGEAVHALARTKVRPSRVRVGKEGANVWGNNNSVSLRDAGSVEYARIPGAGAVVVVRFKKPYAAVYNDGSRPHVIRPKRAKALAFFWTRVGSDVILRSVRHPGTKPTHFLSGSLHAAGEGVSAVYVRALPAASDISAADLRGAA